MKYTKEQFLKAAELGEVSIIDAKHICSLLDEVVDVPKQNDVRKDDISPYIESHNQSSYKREEQELSNDVREDDVEKLAEDNDWEEHIWDDDANKIAENVFPYDIHRTDYATEECRRIFILGFEMAKSTLYTEEQVREAIELALSEQLYYGVANKIEIIKKIKQHK